MTASRYLSTAVELSDISASAVVLRYDTGRKMSPLVMVSGTGSNVEENGIVRGPRGEVRCGGLLALASAGI